MHKHKPLLTTALMMALCGTPVHAGRPLQTDDAGVLAKGGCEAESATLRRSADGGHASATTLQFGCGVGWNSQLAVAALSTRTDGLREAGLAVGGKTGLWQGERLGGEAAALTLAWQVSGVKVPDTSWHHVGSALNLIASLPAGADFTLHANLGHARHELARQRSTTWGVAVEHAGLGEGQRWAPMAELIGADRERPWWNLGLRCAVVAERVFLDVSYGRQFGAGRPALLTLGFKAAF